MRNELQLHICAIVFCSCFGTRRLHHTLHVKGRINMSESSVYTSSSRRASALQIIRTPSPSFENPKQYPSFGALNHPLGCGGPCKFYRTRRGCKDGPACLRCHLCVWNRKGANNESTLKMRILSPEAIVLLTMPSLCLESERRKKREQTQNEDTLS